MVQSHHRVEAREWQWLRTVLGPPDTTDYRIPNQDLKSSDEIFSQGQFKARQLQGINPAPGKSISGDYRSSVSRTARVGRFEGQLSLGQDCISVLHASNKGENASGDILSSPLPIPSLSVPDLTKVITEEQVKGITDAAPMAPIPEAGMRPYQAQILCHSYSKIKSGLAKSQPFPYISLIKSR